MTDGFDLTQHINLRDPELLDEFRHILGRRETGSLTARGAANKIKEDIGERQALDRIQRRFPGARPIVVASRANGVPILDLVLVTEDGRFVVVECKFSSSGSTNLGRSNARMWVPRQGGWLEVPLRGDVVQMSPRWINNRILELERTGQRRLAGQLNQALRSGRFNAYTVVTDSTGEVLKIVDHTPEWTRSFTRKGVEFRPPSPTVEPVPTRVPVAGERATGNRLTAGAIADEAEALAVRRGSVLVADEGAAVAVRGAAVRGAARAVGRVLVAVITRVLFVLNIIGFVMLAVEIISMIWDHFKEKAINEAIEKALKTHIPVEINTALKQHEDEIARHYARIWLNRGNKSETFLYLSPRMTVDGGYGKDGFAFDARVDVKSFANDLVSTQHYDPERKDIVALGPSYYNIEIRWSVDQPIYTPFDIYLAFTEYFVEHVVDSWAMHYATGRKLSPAVVTQFRSTVELLAHISATVKFEPWFGYERGPADFSPNKAAIGRWEALQALSKLIESELIPKVSALESQRLINPATVRWDAYWSPLRSELDPRGEDSLLPAMRRIAIDMKYLDAKHLEYERFETLQRRVRSNRSLYPMLTGNSIESQKQIDLREFLKPVQQYLPKSKTPEPLVLELPFETAGELVLDPID